MGRCGWIWVGVSGCGQMLPTGLSRRATPGRQCSILQGSCLSREGIGSGWGWRCAVWCGVGDFGARCAVFRWEMVLLGVLVAGSSRHSVASMSRSISAGWRSRTAPSPPLRSIRYSYQHWAAAGCCGVLRGGFGVSTACDAGLEVWIGGRESASSASARV